MPDPSIEDLQARIVRLEAASTSSRIGFAALFIVLVLLIPMLGREIGEMIWPRTMLETQTVVARTFVLKDPDGKVVGIFGATNSDGTPQLSLADRNGALRTGLSLDKKGSPSLILADDKKNVNVSLFLDVDGRPTLSLSDGQTGPRATITVSKENEPSFSLFDPTHTDRGAQLGFRGDGPPTLRLYGPGKALDLSSADGVKRWSPDAGPKPAP